jgi:hypothetical protein
LLLDISINENYYKDDLNYEWCGNNAHVVIVGDFLDAKRDFNDIVIKKNITLSTDGITSVKEEKDYGINEYPQIEIKLLKFINSLNKQAINNGGRIIKTFGNHEICNILDKYESFVIKYGYAETYKQINYYKGVNRLNNFKIGGPGYELLIEDNIYVLFKLNNNLFIHGELIDSHSTKSYLSNMTFEDYNYINHIINFNSNLLYKSNVKKEILNKINIIDNISNAYNTIGVNGEDPLWQRKFGNYSNTSARINDNSSFCKNVKNIFSTLKGNNIF